MREDEPQVDGERISRQAENQDRHGIPGSQPGRQGDDLIPDRQSAEAGEDVFFLRPQRVQDPDRLCAGFGMSFGEDPDDDQTEEEREEAEHEEDAVVCDRLNDHGPAHAVEADALGNKIIDGVDSEHRDGDGITHENGLNLPEPRAASLQNRRKERHEPAVRRAVIAVPVPLREGCVCRFHAGIGGVDLPDPPHHDLKCDEDDQPAQRQRQKQRSRVDVKNGILRRRLGEFKPSRAGEQQKCKPRAEEEPDKCRDAVQDAAFGEEEAAQLLPADPEPDQGADVRRPFRDVIAVDHDHRRQSRNGQHDLKDQNETVHAFDMIGVIRDPLRAGQTDVGVYAGIVFELPAVSRFDFCGVYPLDLFPDGIGLCRIIEEEIKIPVDVFRLHARNLFEIRSVLPGDVDDAEIAGVILRQIRDENRVCVVQR